MDRRTFLATTFASTALAQRGAQQPQSAAVPGTAAPAKAKITSSVMLWTLKGTFEQRLETALQSGIQSVELVGEHTKWASADIARVKKLTRSMHLGMDTISSTPNWKQMPISMVDPAQRPNLVQEVALNISFAQRLEVPMLLLMSGDAIAGRTHEEQYKSMVEGARRCGDLAEKAGVTLIIEPLNTKVDHKGYWLSNCVEGLKIVKEVDNPHVRLLFDIYHEQVEMGEVLTTIKEAANYVKVFHVADNPGRHDPGTGTMKYDEIYKTIAKTGYAGHLTMEYVPVVEPVASLQKAVTSMRAALNVT